jgi:prepilin-type N-terminal cleavage/methylation domain-containing protein
VAAASVAVVQAAIGNFVNSNPVKSIDGYAAHGNIEVIVMKKLKLHTSRQKQAGFTIVELLIVIVVIGILAAITIVAYNGIQQRTSNTSRVTSARSAVNLVRLYMTGTGDYPLAAGGGRCIGTGFPNDKCWGTDSPTPAVVDPAFNAKLAQFGTAPRVTTPSVLIKDWVDYGLWHGLGPVYHYSATRLVDGQSKPAVIVYFLDGLNKDCGLSDVIRPVGGGDWPSSTVNNEIDTTMPRFTVSDPAGEGTYCVVSLPTP